MDTLAHAQRKCCGNCENRLEEVDHIPRVSRERLQSCDTNSSTPYNEMLLAFYKDNSINNLPVLDFETVLL